jgi:hypothetical protein
MTYMPVDFLVEDVVSGRPVEGVLVKVFADSGKGVFGEMVTGTDGKANFLLNAPQWYQARAYKTAVGFKNPLHFEVSDDATVKNCFRIEASPIQVPSSTDPRLCLCSGMFKTPSGAPAAGLDIHFITRFHPILLDGAGVLTERITARTDKNGWVQVPLIRNGEFDVLLEGYEDVDRTIAVPDASACNLPDLIFEVVSSVVIAEESLEVKVGETLDVVPSVFTSIGRPLPGTAKDRVVWTVDDMNIASMTVQWDKLILYGNAKGSTLLKAARGDQSIVRIPDPAVMTGIPVRVV